MQKRWLNIKTAIEYSELGRDRLKRLAGLGDIVGFQDPENHNKWIFDRESIDQYLLNIHGNIELKALAIMKRCNV